MVSWAGLLFVRKTYCLSCNGLAEENNSSLLNYGCPKLSCVVVNKYDNIDNKDNNSSLIIMLSKLSCVVVNKYDNIDNQRQQFITP